MANEKRLIDANAIEAKIEKNFRKLIANQSRPDLAAALSYVGDLIIEAPTVDAVPVAEIEEYLQARLDEWEALGDRKWEPANMWGYNFIRACFDDLERRNDGTID